MNEMHAFLNATRFLGIGKVKIFHCRPPAVLKSVGKKLYIPFEETFSS